ncbi:uncharacterized protein AMSG_00367 [Thecamonas trahens ATCC 50062]|uniref:Uncharacterized protein n=1 Tax=Thecamonas trahens ATCC 50062 TaxID=461836 RepID=A0A0L0D8Q0_THETB|nr:hypothetical protein AMSG_00367 [Thecamonas trahens ATCC 50062]KNC48590.1 hypothetical protein AMSG_00367 [Thecamonas trahens ATCC 50062]|eukprot:XP_013762646.1 hypothetical protein AMSG_00367 [Thecamonas trahens ATCC 50062]
MSMSYTSTTPQRTRYTPQTSGYTPRTSGNRYRRHPTSGSSSGRLGNSYRTPSRLSSAGSFHAATASLPAATGGLCTPSVRQRRTVRSARPARSARQPLHHLRVPSYDLGGGDSAGLAVLGQRAGRRNVHEDSGEADDHRPTAAAIVRAPAGEQAQFGDVVEASRAPAVQRPDVGVDVTRGRSRQGRRAADPWEMPSSSLVPWSGGSSPFAAMEVMMSNMMRAFGSMGVGEELAPALGGGGGGFSYCSSSVYVSGGSDPSKAYYETRSVARGPGYEQSARAVHDPQTGTAQGVRRRMGETGYEVIRSADLAGNVETQQNYVNMTADELDAFESRWAASAHAHASRYMLPSSASGSQRA